NLEKIFKANSLPLMIEQKIKHLESLKKQLDLLIKNKIQISFLEFEKLKNAYLQHENFFEKSKHLVSLRKNGKIVRLEELKSGDTLLLSSQNVEKEAKIL
ncbi:TPA: exodeoxyribonuclease VII large subunit, partial [Campylobacter upsaliensis]|nr:exodeoxyribonuclease VII large subunit [Campylobacter upsaliensis]